MLSLAVSVSKFLSGFSRYCISTIWDVSGALGPRALCCLFRLQISQDVQRVCQGIYLFCLKFLTVTFRPPYLPGGRIICGFCWTPKFSFSKSNKVKVVWNQIPDGVLRMAEERDGKGPVVKNGTELKVEGIALLPALLFCDCGNFLLFKPFGAGFRSLQWKETSWWGKWSFLGPEGRAFLIHHHRAARAGGSQDCQPSLPLQKLSDVIKCAFHSFLFVSKSGGPKKPLKMHFF